MGSKTSKDAVKPRSVLETKEPPPKEAIEASESRGDVLYARSTAGVEVRFYVCKWRQIEVFVEGKWANSLGSLQISDESEDYIDLYDEEEPVLRLQKEEAQGTLSKLVRLCNRAAIPHDLVMATPVMRCKYCNHVKNEHGVRTLCNVKHRLHDDDDYDGSGDSPVQDWMSATVLPPGCTLNKEERPVGGFKEDGWYCAACTYRNSGKRSMRCCGVCGAARPVVPASPHSPACPDCKVPLCSAPPFCARTSRPHLIPKKHEKKEAPMKACGACNKALANTILMPCRHLSACASCAPSLGACPRCSTGVTHRLEVYA
eukprot:TRINITY_DN33867_c0_g1_i1.p1 TRINITY_DN33867_c0_g1~~TRINITY_DN33867_c0_g1_i1.p1  ORF type:complete len:315 (+),score=97.78 TRINITY_DN33867_c0_g1_i1:49-993(+)